MEEGGREIWVKRKGKRGNRKGMSALLAVVLVCELIYTVLIQHLPS